ncbi:MAG: HAMP domain-containing sensor histidine kinase [Gammaproteobacteria bacterium]|nr:HAMP domain-containing sensor histidine kinase [Gammaproteobacteria bacterium]
MRPPAGQAGDAAASRARQAADAEAAQRALAQNWRALRFFSFYRIILALLLGGLLFTTDVSTLIGSKLPVLAAATVAAYLVFGLVAGLGVRWRWPGFHFQVLLQVTVDILLITVLMLASGGVRSGLGPLLVVAIAGGSILTVGRTAFLFAAFATLAVLVQEVLAWLYFLNTSYTQSGMLGATFFATAYLAYSLATRIRESERLARQRGLDLANLSLLNEHIIRRMQSGIVAVDADNRVRLLNESARRLLGVGKGMVGGTVSQLSRELATRLAQWRNDELPGSAIVRPEHGEVSVISSFAALDDATSGNLLIFLEDSSAVTQRAQQLKLASLGRLTASIAHEIRNPLGAISHAAQLLNESPDLSPGDRRLGDIIQDHCTRVNDIIENVTRLSRQHPLEPMELDLGAWCEAYIKEAMLDPRLQAGDLALHVEGGRRIMVRMDESQLRQVVNNLCENGLRYGREAPRVLLVVGLSAESERPYLEVYDSGPGVDEETAGHLFEPFFTTERSGTGLGLYIARELCELNQATLGHLGRTPRGHGFRISFSHPQRQGLPGP